MNFQYHILHCKMFDNEDLMRLSVDARWLFIYLWGNRFIDYEGRQSYSLETLKRNAFPYDTRIGIKSVKKALQELACEKFIVIYQADIEGKLRDIIEVTSFAKLQNFRTARFKQSIYPAPDGTVEVSEPPVKREPVKRIKPKAAGLAELETKIDESVRSTWDLIKAMYASARNGGSVSESVLALYLTKLIESGLTPEQMVYGMGCALRANAEAVNYAIKAGRNYQSDDTFKVGRII